VLLVEAPEQPNINNRFVIRVAKREKVLATLKERKIRT
jgi:hypothetical protein